MKLDELRVEHQTNEATGESVISCLNDKLSEVSSEVVMYHKDYTICSKYKHLCQGFLSSDLIKVACQSICSP